MPTGNDKEFNRLKETYTGFCNDPFEEEILVLEDNPVDKSTGHLDPMNWFGILVPQTLKAARENFDQAIELSVKAANIRMKIARRCEMIPKLRCLKADKEFKTVDENKENTSTENTLLLN